MKCKRCTGSGLLLNAKLTESEYKDYWLRNKLSETGESTCPDCHGYGTMKYVISPIRRTNRRPDDNKIIGWRIIIPEGWLIKMEPTFELAVVWMDLHAAREGRQEIA